MKIRFSFVSNSSSSSFVLGTFHDLTTKEGRKLLKKELLEAFGVSEKSPLYYVAKGLTEEIINGTNYNMSRKWYEADLQERREDDEAFCAPEEKLVGSGMKVYLGIASSEGDAMEVLLCDFGFSLDNGIVFFDKEGGY